MEDFLKLHVKNKDSNQLAVKQNRLRLIIQLQSSIKIFLGEANAE